jgi:hypothetical protein
LATNSKYHDIYQKEDLVAVYHNDDPILKTIEVPLPSIESFFGKPWDEAVKLIDGYGLHPKNQRFNHQKVPDKLANIQDLIRKKMKLKKKEVVSQNDIYDELESNRLEYREEIAWIQLQIKRRYQGYWFFNNGKPTYIDGWHYVYLNFWDIQNETRQDSLPWYRDLDRRIFIYARYCYTTTEAVYKYRVTYRTQGEVKVKYFQRVKNAEEFAAKFPAAYIDEGAYVVDMGYRTCYGYIFPKRRRIGATSQAACMLYCIVTEHKQQKGGIQSITETQARNDVYIDKIVKPWRKIPFFLKPSHDGTDFPKEKLSFSYSASRAQGATHNRVASHDGWIEARASSERSFDGQKLHAYLDDEGGKHGDSGVSIPRRWQDVVRKCLSQGLRINGLGMFTSTLGEFEAGGGKEFFDLIKSSYYDERNENGFTTSGLFTLFIPAYDGYDECVDEYGLSIIEDPIEPVKNLEGNIVTRGAKTILMNTRKDLEEKGLDLRLNGEIRDNPWTLQEAASKASKNSNFDLSILRTRINQLKFDRVFRTRNISLDWKDGFGSEVVVTDNAEGKYTVSFVPPHEQRNKKMFDSAKNGWFPSTQVSNRYILGCDPFKFGNRDVKGRRKSNGGGALFYKHDPAVDSQDKPIDQWISNKFVVTYNTRVDDGNTYCEDMLKLAILFGAHVYPERNVPIVIEKFREWGYEGYLLYDIDPNGKLATAPGRYTGEADKEQIFTEFMNYIKVFGRSDNHIEMLEECLEINDPTEMTNYDLFAAGGMALLGAKSALPKYLQEMTEVKKMNDLLEFFDS